MDWHAISFEKTAQELHCDSKTGLTQNEATRRLENGRNELTSKHKINPFGLFLSQFKDALIIVLIVAATISLGLSLYENNGEYKEALLIYAIVLVIAFVGFFNEFKAEKTINALKQLVGHTARVRRDGKLHEIDSVLVVPGDIVLLEAGQKVPADIRLAAAKELHINEASLTGESEAVTKHIEPVNENAIVADRKCMAYSGTFVTNGTGWGVVVATGESSEIGTIARLVDDVEVEATPMQQKLDDLGKKLGYIIAVICAIVFFVVLFMVPSEGDSGTIHRIIFAFTAAVALAVAAIPEGLAFVVRISLALGSRRMAAKNALVRKLSAVEALGSTDVICSDKTGTLTKGEMTVREVYVNGKVVSVTGSGYDVQGSFSEPAKSLELLLTIGLMCNDAKLKKDAVIGDATEAALLVSAEKFGLKSLALHKKLPRHDEIPFSSERKMMSTIHKNSSQHIVYTKGAAEVLIAKCSHHLDENGNLRPLTAEVKKAILTQTHAFRTQALRVLGFAYRELKSTNLAKKDIEKDLVFVGLQAMIDPPRKEVIEVVKEVQEEAGIRVVMITGDHIETARAIAKEIGIAGRAVTGADLDKLNDHALSQQIDEIGIYARVSPAGDGVNDAPALKAADIGIAMGKSGSDVAKEAADLILLDDQFLTIIKAIEEGRGIFENVRKFVNFLISCNIAEVLTILVGILVYQNLLLTAAQLLFINIVTDGLPAVALGSDPARKNVLKSKPHLFQGAIINKKLWIEIFIFGIVMSTILAVQYYFLNSHGHEVAVATLFTAMVVYELLHLIDIRSQYKISWLSNPWLIVSILFSFGLQFIVLYVPAVAANFDAEPIGLAPWIIIGIGAVAISIIMRTLSKIHKSELVRGLD